MSRIFQKIEVGQDFTEEGIQDAIERNFQSIMRSDMSRFAYARATLRFDSVRDLPFAHVMDHRVRLPRLEITSVANDCDLTHVVLDRLNRMLCVSSHPGGRELVAKALRLNPDRDADALVEIFKGSHRLFDLLLRGQMGSAIALAKQLNFPGLGADGFQRLAANLLCYHCAHQVQLVTVRSNALDQFAYKIEATQREFTVGGAYKNVCQILKLIEASTRRVLDETRQSSQNAIVLELEDRAEDLRAHIPLSDADLLSKLQSFFQDQRSQLNQHRAAVEPFREMKSSLHKSIFGLTAFQTLVFSTSRLVQINLRASKIIDAEINNRSNTFDFVYKELPARTSKAVSKLAFCYRCTILRDKGLINSIPDRGLGDIATEWTNRSDGNVYAYDAIVKARKKFRGIQRNALSFPVSGQLDNYQSIDILPEFILQERVDGVPPGQKLLDSAKKAHAQKQSHRPPNVRRASGRR